MEEKISNYQKHFELTNIPFNPFPQILSVIYINKHQNFVS